MNDTDIAAAGLDADKVKLLVERLHREIEPDQAGNAVRGLLPSCQVAIARHGRVVFETTLGDASSESRYVIFSATKTLVATAVWILLDEGKLGVDDLVAAHVPEFASHGKDVITLEQVLLHTSGFPHAPMRPIDWETRERRLAAFARWRLNWEPGTRFEYHPTSAHWVLAELIDRVSGSDYLTFIRERVLEPIGLTRYQLGVPREQQGDITTLENVGEPMTPDELEAVLGVRELPITEVTPEALLQFNQPSARAVGVPGGGGVSNASDLAMFYQALLRREPRLISDDAYDQFTAKVRNSFPDYLGTPANRALGMVIAGDDGKANLRGMGNTVSARAFGHNGAGGQIAFGDPATGLSFVYLTNGLDQHVVRQARRTTAIASHAAACVAD